MPNRTRIWICVYFLVTLLLISVGHQMLKTTKTGREISETLWGLNLLHYSKILEKVSRREWQTFEQAVLEKRAKTLPDRPILSHPSGIYPDGIVVSVALAPNALGYFSLDGSIPTRSHNRVSGPILISESAVLRAKSFVGSATSETVTATYIVTGMTGVAAANLVMDPVYLFNRHAGIYSNPTQRGRAWERPAILSIIDPVSGNAFEAEVRVRIHGGASRGSSNEGRKSIRINLRRRDGDLRSWLDICPTRISPDQSEWILRHAGNRRQLWSDRFVLRIARQLGLPASAARPIVLHLNGKRWGVYDLMERVNQEFLVGKEARRDFALLHGSPLRNPLKNNPEYAEWNLLYRFIFENDLSDPSLYSFVESQIDIETLIDYYALSIFMADSDRPQGNIDLYREKARPGGRPGKWKFAVWDFDGGLNYRGVFAQHDTLAWHLRSSLRTDLKPFGREDNEQMISATRLLRGLMRNAEFRDAFKQRFNTLLVTTFAADNLYATLDELLRDYAEVVPLEQQRFDNPAQWLLHGDVRLTATDDGFSYDDRMNEIRTFISERPGVVARLLKEHLDR